MQSRIAANGIQSYSGFDGFLSGRKELIIMLTRPIYRNRKVHRVLAEIVFAVRFGLVGSLATVLHVAILWMLLSETFLSVLMANTIAFICAFGVSFSGNYFWTFGTPGSPKRAMLRFLTISVIAFLINSVLLGMIIEFDWLDPLQAAISAATAIPAFTFFASRYWGFMCRNQTLGSTNSEWN